jgi:site-specific recombinase XerD
MPEKTDIVLSTDRSPAPSDPTADVLDRLADFLRLNVAEGDAAESTIRVYLIHIRQFVEWAAGEGVEPALAAHRDLVLYRRWLSEEGYTRATVGTKLAAVRRFYEAAKWHGYRDDNPAEGVKPPREHTSKRDRILARYLSREQVKALLDAPDASTDAGIRDRAMIGLMYYHGLRVSEVAALTVGSVVAGDPPKLSIERSKGGRDRVVFLIPKTREWLGAWAARRKSHVTDETDGALFVSFGVTAAGTPLTPDGIRWVVNGYLKDLGYYRPGLSCHALRHAHASHVVAAGGDLVALANEMGHASTETTNVYTHVADAVGRNPAALLAETDGE